MKSKNVLLILIVVVALVIIFYNASDSQDDGAYVESVIAEREQTDRFMRNSKESPFKGDSTGYTGLHYYDPDPAYRLIAQFKPVDKKEVVLLATNDGKEQQYAKYGYAEFELGGRHRLLIYQGIGAGQMRGKLFIPFGDETSARETYGGGRYLDVKHTPGSMTLVLDFNKAYNPYCAYNDSYSCPLPPAENLLPVAVKAGEKNYKD